MVYDGVISKVEFDKVEAAFPALVPEAVIVIGIAVKGNVEPVFIRRVPFLFLYIVESPKASADVVENAVEDDADAGFVKCRDDFLKVSVRAETAVDKAVVSGVIAVRVRFKDR